MARVVLPLEPWEREALERLSRETGLSVPVLLDLRRRGYRVVEDEANGSPGGPGQAPSAPKAQQDPPGMDEHQL